MSDCIIQIKIGDQVLTLDPNSDISPDNGKLLVDSIDTNKLRILYSNLKDKLNIDNVLRNTDKEQALGGEAIYNDIVKTATKQLGGADDKDSIRDNFISPLRAMTMVSSPEDKKALAAYVGSLPSNDVQLNGNFLEDMKNAYKLSPYSKDMIRELVFKRNPQELNLFNQLASSPGLGTLRMSIAAVEEVNNRPLNSIVATYLTPDNIIQVLVPKNEKWYTKPASTDTNAHIDAANLKPAALKIVRNSMLHELSHAVFSELYESDRPFKEVISTLKQRYLTEIAKQDDPRSNSLALEYQGERGTHEFLADVFNNPRLQTDLSRVVSESKIYQSLGHGDLYDLLISNLKNTGMQNANSLLKDVMSVMSSSVPSNTLTTSFQQEAQNFVANPNKDSIFFQNDLSQGDINAHINPEDQTQSYWTMNDRALWISEKFAQRLDVDKKNIKDAHYSQPIRDITPARLDQLKPQDLAIIPWVRYQRSPVDGQPGQWLEVGVILDKRGKPLMKGKDFVLADITRNGTGEVVQNSELGQIEPRERTLPVVYSSSKTKRVTLAKVGITKDSNQDYNSISIPYDMIKAVRGYDNTYFDHSHDFTEDAEYAQSRLVEARANSSEEAKFDGTTYWEKQLKQAENNQVKALATREEMISDYHKYAFRYKDINGSTVINDTKHPNETSPNPKVFDIIDEPHLGKEWARASSTLPDSVSRGDMVRIFKSYQTKQAGENVTVNGHEWVVVHKKLANGLLISTSKGEGFILPFTNIDAYAKNKTTDEYQSLLLKLTDALDDVKRASYNIGEDGKKKYNTEVLKSTSLNFNPDYNQLQNETEEDAITRFADNLDLVKKRIKPGETFVTVQRSIQDRGSKEVSDYPSLEIVMAHTNDGVYTLRKNNEGHIRTEYIGYDQKLNASKPWGAELRWLKEDVGRVRDVYNQYLAEKQLFKDNTEQVDGDGKTTRKDSFINVGTKESPKVIPAFDFKANPRNIRDLVDVYEEVNGVKIARLNQGDYVGVKFDPGDRTDLPEFMWRKVMRVLEDGTVVVADKRKQSLKDTRTGYEDQVQVYPRYVNAGDILRVGYMLGRVEGSEDDGFTSEFHQEIIDRRQKMYDYATRDMDFNDFIFRDAAGAQKWNANAKYTDSWHDRFVPLTNKVVTPKTLEDEVTLNKKLEPVEPSKGVWVKAKFNGETLGWVLRGVNANTTYFKREKIIQFKGKQQVIHPDILKEIMPGDWVVSTYRDKDGQPRQWHSLIDRVEGGNIYKRMDDNTTQPVNVSKITALRTSFRNDKYSNFERNDRIKSVMTNLADTKGKRNLSLDTPYKSAADSQRAIFEVGDRLQQLNPDIQLNYLNADDVQRVFQATSHNYNDVRAFVMDGKVNINLAKASVSDLVHEYAHLFLHSLKYENNGLYNTLIDMAAAHPMYDTIASTYSHLSNPDDVKEEVFVTLLGEHMRGKFAGRENSWMDDAQDKGNVMNFAGYTKQLLDKVMSDQPSLYDTKPEEILSMKLEDVMNLVGDTIMKSRISDMGDWPDLQDRFDIGQLKQDLKDRGLITEECYG